VGCGLWVGRLQLVTRAVPPIVLERFRPSPFYLELDAPDGIPRRRFRFRTPETCGHYDRVEGRLVALFRRGADEWLRIDERVWRLDGTVGSDWRELDGGRCRFELTAGGAAVFTCTYRVPVSRLDAADPGFEPGRNDFLRAVHGRLGGRSRV
jgi:hypothetical protein